jgi:hypothetical protein
VLKEVVKEVGGRTLIRYGDGTELEFASIEEAVAWARSADTNIDMTRRMCAAYAEARSTNWANIAPVANKTFTFDLSAPSPIKVQ